MFLRLRGHVTLLYVMNVFYNLNILSPLSNSQIVTFSNLQIILVENKGVEPLTS